LDIRSVLKGYIILKDNELEKINGDGLLGIAAGMLLGFTYGMAAGGIIAYNTGEVKICLKQRGQLQW